MTEQELNEIQARADAATPGPWEHRGKSVRTHVAKTDYGAPSGWDGGICNTLGASPAFNFDPLCRKKTAQAQTNAVFIAAARSDVPALVAEVRRLQDGLSGLIYYLTRNGLGDAADKAREVLEAE